MTGLPNTLEKWYAEEHQPATDAFGDTNALSYARVQLIVAARVIEQGMNIGCDLEKAKTVAAGIVGLALPYDALVNYAETDVLSGLFEGMDEEQPRTQQLAPVISLAEVRQAKKKTASTAPRERRNIKELPFLLDRTCEKLEEEIQRLMPSADQTARREFISKLCYDLETKCREIVKNKSYNSVSGLDSAARHAVVAQKLHNYVIQTGQFAEDLAKIKHALGVYIKTAHPHIAMIVYRATDRSVMSPKDLHQEAVIGLMTALGRYDLSQTSLVMTYCSKRIHGSVIDAIRNYNKDTRTRGDIDFHNMREQMLGAGLTDEQIVKELGMSDEKYRKKLAQTRRSGVRPLEDVMANMIPAKETTPEQEADKDANIKVVHQLLERVDEKDADFIAMRFGLFPYDRPHTLREIGEVNGYTESRASQILSGIMDSLRHHIKPLL